MNPKESADKLGIDTQQLFVRAHKMYGTMWSISGPVDTHRCWLKTGAIPIYVAQYMRYLDRRVAVVNGHPTGG